MPEPRPAPAIERPVIVVGAGIAGIACARCLHEAGLPVQVLERAPTPGGRMAVQLERLGEGRHWVDTGASYFTVRDEEFAEVVRRWQSRGLASEWTDTFRVLSAAGLAGTTTGLMRWRAARGLASLVADLAEGLDVRCGVEVEQVDVDPAALDLPRVGSRPTGSRSGLIEGAEFDNPWEVRESWEPGLGDGPQRRDAPQRREPREPREPVESLGLRVDGMPAAAVVLAMPQPQATDLLPEPISDVLGLPRGEDWAPALSVWALWSRRWWAPLDGAFVSGSPVLSWIADDGARRGDGAPLLVAHTTGAFAADRLDDPGSAVGPVLAELRRLLTGSGSGSGSGSGPGWGFGSGPGSDRFVAPGPPPEPEWVRVRRWSLAAPRHPDPRPFALHPAMVGVCGDAWGGPSRVEQAWRSGHLLGRELAWRLGR